MKSEFSKYLRALGKKGGIVRAQKLNAKRRKAIARKAARARWDRRK